MCLSFCLKTASSYADGIVRDRAPPLVTGSELTAVLELSITIL